MFESSQQIVDNTIHIKLLNIENGDCLTILPQLGAAIHALELQKNGVLFDLIDGYCNEEKVAGINYYKGKILYPFPNRVAGGAYMFEGKQYQLPINETDRGNALHGLISEEEFTVQQIEILQNKASISLYYDVLGLEDGFPFKSRLNVTYTITDQSRFICTAIIESKDVQNQPVGIGWHPYFKMKNKVDKLNLYINSEKIFDVDSKMIPTGKFESENLFKKLYPIDNNFLDTGYEVSPENEVCTTQIFDSENEVTLNIWQQTGLDKYNYLQIYTPSHRNSIAIEPMTCAVDAFNNGLGLICLKPSEKIEVKFGVFLS